MPDIDLRHGDCLNVLRADELGYDHRLGYAPPAIPDASVDAVVTDPPYGLGFMGKEWDKIKQEASRPRDGQLRELHQKTPFADQPFEKVKAELKRLYVSRALGEAVSAFYQNARSRLQVTILD